jgi:hypothetical protein
MVHSPPNLLDPQVMVSQLIDVDTKWWNEALLQQLFYREEVISIQSVPLSATNQEDTLIWKKSEKWQVKQRDHLVFDVVAYGDPFGGIKYQMRRNAFYGMLATRYYPQRQIYFCGK